MCIIHLAMLNDAKKVAILLAKIRANFGSKDRVVNVQRNGGLIHAWMHIANALMKLVCKDNGFTNKENANKPN